MKCIDDFITVSKEEEEEEFSQKTDRHLEILEKMASNRREAAANYFVHDSYEVDTADNEVSFFSFLFFFHLSLLS